MKTIGIITTAIAGVAALWGVVIGVRAVPDLKRYLRIKAM
jgi:hypothetical protein